MFILLFIIVTACLRIPALACECAHVYDADIISLIESEGDTYLDDYLYQREGIKTQMIYGIDPPNPKKILHQAQYAFDSFRYNKCLEKIKEYERTAFPPPHDFPSSKEKLVILAYKAYANKFLKKYDSAINYFEEMIDIIKKTDHLALECKFITYLEHAHCYLLKGDKKEYKNRVKKILDLDIAPRYEYYVKNGFKIHHQPCFHNHEMKYEEKIIFKEAAPKLLGEELYAMMEAREETPKIYTVANNTHDNQFCRRMCSRATTIIAVIVGCITQKAQAAAAIMILSELMIDCDICCNEGWGSKNCLEELKWVLSQVCNQNLLDDL